MMSDEYTHSAQFFGTTKATHIGLFCHFCSRQHNTNDTSGFHQSFHRQTTKSLALFSIHLFASLTNISNIIFCMNERTKSPLFGYMYIWWVMNGLTQLTFCCFFRPGQKGFQRKQGHFFFSLSLSFSFSAFGQKYWSRSHTFIQWIFSLISY